MAALSRSELQARADVDVGPRYLAREMARSEAQYIHYLRWSRFEEADFWAEYRDRVATWRFNYTRGRIPPDLQACTTCGRVVQQRGLCVVCFACERSRRE